MTFDSRTRPVPDDLVALVRDAMERRGPRGAARVLGISKPTVIAICAGLPVMPGTLALLWAAERRRRESEAA
jgi:hypothetical protein